MLAPFIGGCLSDPVHAYPGAAKRLPQCLADLLREYPFLLPNLVVAVSNVLAIFIFIFKLKETRNKETPTESSGHE